MEHETRRLFNGSWCFSPYMFRPGLQPGGFSSLSPHFGSGKAEAASSTEVKGWSSACEAPGVRELKIPLSSTEAWSNSSNCGGLDCSAATPIRHSQCHGPFAAVKLNLEDYAELMYKKAEDIPKFRTKSYEDPELLKDGNMLRLACRMARSGMLRFVSNKKGELGLVSVIKAATWNEEAKRWDVSLRLVFDQRGDNEAWLGKQRVAGDGDRTRV